MEYSTSSKRVTVEYTDPSSIYAVISEDLQKRLPLRNLYWNSATRPLRSISSLHIELVPAGSSDSSSDPLDRANSGRPNGAVDNFDGRDIWHEDRPGSGVGLKKGRRHQIPGLRQTPYLKIFFLRCSDIDSYRVTYRKHIREWIKENAPPTQSTASVNTHEFHDAFEWLIVHVVLPDDGRSISRASATSKNESRSSLGGSSAVTEKIRADFNGSSKNAVDRVSLIQINRGLQTGQNQTSPDGWEDFIAKTKSLILSSFDLRVTQYEEDIKEREAQRNIPGWNFNTFFVLKEGLARGFESVGLIEDALNGYRELAAGLNSFIEGRDVREQHGEHFKDFTDDLSAALKSTLQLEESQNARQQETVAHSNKNGSQPGDCRPVMGVNVLDADRKPFRELILANEISEFDFQCYLFAREVSLLLRLANATGLSGGGRSLNGARTEVASKAASPGSPNILRLAEVCRQAIVFFSDAGRMIRDDLRSSVHPLSKGHTIGSPTAPSIFDGPIEDLVASWTYSACQQILDATRVPSLEALLQPLLRSLKPIDEGYAIPGNCSDPLPREELPRRTSSLPMSAYVSPKPLSSDGSLSMSSLDAVRLLPPASTQTGIQELAAQQAELVILMRRVTASVGHRSTDAGIKRASLADSLSQNGSDMEEISLEDTLLVYNSVGESPHLPHRSAANSIQSERLRQSLGSESKFNQVYEELTTMALALNVLGGRRRFAEILAADLAISRYRARDYGSAASYFGQLSSIYCNNDWTRLEVPMLDLFARCLKHLDRKQDFCRIGLRILVKTTSRQPLLHHHTVLGVSHFLQDVIDVSSRLEQPVSTPLHLHFEGIYFDPYIQHSGDRDGFRTSLSLRNIMSAAFEAQHIRVKLVCLDEEQRCDIWMTSQGPTLLQRGVSHVILQSTVMCQAWYRVERVEIRSANIVFTHDVTAPTNDAAPDGLPISDGVLQLNSTRVLVWPDKEALEARLALCKFIHLGKPRSIEVLISSGRNKVSYGRVSIRACSAGLRLHTAETNTVSGNCVILRNAQAGSIDFGTMDARSKTTLRMPYGIDSDLSEIKIRVDVSYTVEEVGYQFNCTEELPIRLPLSVNVQDNFQARVLFSNFKVDTANSIPMRIGDYTMHSTKAFQVTLPALSNAPLTIFARQPLSLVAQIRQRRQETSDTRMSLSTEKTLMLRIQYACLDQEIGTTLENALLEALNESELGDLSRLLVIVLGKALLSALSPQDLETIGLLGEIQMSSFEQDLWQPVLNGLHADRRDKTAQWLAKWQAENPVIVLPQVIDSRNVLGLTVPFEIPEIPVVVTGRLETFGCGGGPEEGRFAAIDQSLLADLSLSYSRHWSKHTDVASECKSLSIEYEVQASSEQWLIGGQRKGQFTAEQGEVNRFPIIMLPQKTGHLLYPSVDVRITTKPESNRGSKSTEDAPEDIIPCELDYLDQGESVLIVPDLNSSTVSLESSGPGGGAWLVESRSRSEKR